MRTQRHARGGFHARATTRTLGSYASPCSHRRIENGKGSWASGNVARNPGINVRIAREHEVTPAQIALPWVLRQDGVIAISKAAESEHVLENREALEVHLTEQDLPALDEEFPPPNHRVPLEML